MVFCSPFYWNKFCFFLYWISFSSCSNDFPIYTTLSYKEYIFQLPTAYFILSIPLHFISFNCLGLNKIEYKIEQRHLETYGIRSRIKSFCHIWSCHVGAKEALRYLIFIPCLLKSFQCFTIGWVDSMLLYTGVRARLHEHWNDFRQEGIEPIKRV